MEVAIPRICGSTTFCVFGICYNIRPNEDKSSIVSYSKYKQQIVEAFKKEFDEKYVEVYDACFNSVKLIFKIPKNTSYCDIFYGLEDMLIGSVVNIDEDVHLKISRICLFK